MTKKEFLTQLREELVGYDQSEVAELIKDYEQHFEDGVKEKRSEAEIAEKLGDPRLIAKEYKTAALVKKAEEKPTVLNVSRALLAFIGMGFFNLVFVFGPYMGALGLLFGGVVTAFAMVVTGFTGIGMALLSPFLTAVEWGTSPIAAFFYSIATVCFGMLLAIGMVQVIRWFFSVTLSYIKFNLSIVTGSK